MYSFIKIEFLYTFHLYLKYVYTPTQKTTVLLLVEVHAEVHILSFDLELDALR